MKPVTPLPWVKATLGSHKFAIHSPSDASYASHLLKSGDVGNVDYMVHASNAYPQLVAKLREAIKYCPIDKQNEIFDLLRSLGEAA